MIFVTLGSQKFPFNRLLEAVDRLWEEGRLREPVFAQTGCSDYQPKHYPYQPFLDRDAFSKKMDQADIVITHGGTGAIIGAVKKGKKVIAVPRLARYGEHVDDHQLQLIEQFRELNLICACLDTEDLGQAVEEVRNHVSDQYVSNTSTVIESIEGFLARMLEKEFV